MVSDCVPGLLVNLLGEDGAPPIPHTSFHHRTTGRLASPETLWQHRTTCKASNKPSPPRSRAHQVAESLDTTCTSSHPYSQPVMMRKAR